jgi:hypothetical protein
MIDYLASFYSDDNPTARAVSRVEQLAQSTCKRMSGDQIGVRTGAA